MELESIYEIPRAAEFIYSRNFTIIALQFPDELLKDSMRVVKALKDKLHSLRAAANESGRDDREVRLFVMADTMFGSCCVDEVGASHVDAECVIHYGHTCLSPTSKLPAFFVFGKASIDACHCSQNIYNYALTRKKPIVILFGLEYAHAMQHLKEALDAQSLKLCGSVLTPVFHFANVMCSAMNPSNDYTKSNDHLNAHGGSRYRIGGLLWCSPEGKRVEDYLIFWIGSDNSAFANVVLTFNGCDVVRYDAAEKCLKTDVSQQKRILKRRYYLVEKAKDANIIGILVGTLGVAGYLHMIQQMKELITGAGKKAYTFVMGKPNPAKLANFPECDVFIYVACAQTALLDSKEYYAPVITPFEAMLALSRGSQWTGAYSMEFQDLITSSPVQTQTRFEEARFSFLKGGYIEDVALEENIEPEKDVLALANATEKVLQVREKHTNSIIKGTAKSGAEYLATRSYQGLAMPANNSFPEPYLIGRTGRASGYESERAGRDYFSTSGKKEVGK